MIQWTDPTTQAVGHQSLDRRRLIGGAGLLLAGAGGRALAQDIPDRPPPVPPPEALALSANLLTRMAAVVRLNNSRSLTFVLDTGAERTAIARDLAESLGLAPGPLVRVHGVTSAQSTPTARVPHLHFGRRRFNDLVLPVFERSLLAADGLLGLDVLSQFRLSMDLQRRTVVLSPSGPAFLARGTASFIATRLPGGARARADTSGQLILTNAVAAGIGVQAFVDSGAQYSIGNMALLRAVNGQVDRRPIPLYGVTGQTIDTFAGRLGDLRLGQQRLGETPLLFADLHAFDTLGLSRVPALLIGADILYRFQRIELDYASRRMGFSGLRRPTAPPSTGGV